MKKITLATILIGITIVSCNGVKNDTIKEQILHYCSDRKECLVEIKDLTKFKWSKMFVFRYDVTKEEIQKIIQSDYPYYKEFTDKLVFLQGNKIVYHEDNSSNIEGNDNCDLVFVFSDTLKFESYTPKEAVFKFKNVEGTNGVFYELTKSDK